MEYNYVIAWIITVLLLIGVLFYLLSLVNLFRYKVPHVATFTSDLAALRKAFSQYSVSGKKIVDLWSGTWKIVRLLTKEYHADVTGYEIDPSNYFLSKMINSISNVEAKVYKKNYLTADLVNFDCIYIYLYPCLIERVEKKIFAECEENTLIFVNAFPFLEHTPLEVFQSRGKDQIYVYKV